MMALCSRPCKTQTPVPLPLPAMALSHHTLASCANLWELQSPTLDLWSLSLCHLDLGAHGSSLSPELKCHLIRGPPTLCSLFYLLAGGARVVSDLPPETVRAGPPLFQAFIESCLRMKNTPSLAAGCPGLPAPPAQPRACGCAFC